MQTQVASMVQKKNRTIWQFLKVYPRYLRYQLFRLVKPIPEPIREFISKSFSGLCSLIGLIIMGVVGFLFIVVSWIMASINYKQWHAPLSERTELDLFWFLALPFLMWFVQRAFINEYTVEEHSDLLHSKWWWRVFPWRWWPKIILRYLGRIDIYLSWYSRKWVDETYFDHEQIPWIKCVLWLVLVLPLGISFFGDIIRVWPVVVEWFNNNQPYMADEVNYYYDILQHVFPFLPTFK